jgi:hypothetical protein
LSDGSASRSRLRPLSPRGVAIPFRVLSGSPSSAASVWRSLFVVGRREVLARASSTMRSSSSNPRRVACDHATVLSWGCALLQGMPRSPRRAPLGPRPLPWGSVPYSAFSVGSTLHPEVPPPGTFRLQGFAPSCRLTPPGALRVCFTPVALLGFHPSGVFPPKEPRHLIGVRRALVAFSPVRSDVHGPRRCPALPSRAASFRGGAFLRLQGLEPPGSPYAAAG